MSLSLMNFEMHTNCIRNKQQKKSICKFLRLVPHAVYNGKAILFQGFEIVNFNLFQQNDVDKDRDSMVGR